MRVFVTGASGALGSRLVPQLIDAGHEVVGTYNSPASAELLLTLGARAVAGRPARRTRGASRPCWITSLRRSCTRRRRLGR
jgi:nucleoside-diphosphate-sugar epimerase